MEEIKTDFLIIGSGLAGLYAALLASRHGRVTIITKSLVDLSSSSWAQGSVAAALGSGDSHASHAADTIEAGRGLCNPKAVEILTNEGPARVLELRNLGVPFETAGSELELGLEGGHSHRRIVHADGGATGNAIVCVLICHVRENPRVQIRENTVATALLSDPERCFGAQALDIASGKSIRIVAPVTILATGGLAGLFHTSTNPPTSTGDGIALAYDAGAETMDMEFDQFHPTAFYSPDGQTFLISEAVRGEGAHLLYADGKRFMLDKDPQAELAPRDVLSWFIHQELKRTGADCVYLTMKHLPSDAIRRRFSLIANECKQRGLDLATDPVPVAPAAHYTIGGVKTGTDARTNLAGLWACGECAATGVHGANRLASNSLLECVVFAKRAVDDAASLSTLPIPSSLDGIASIKTAMKANNMEFDGPTRLMTDHVGLVRNSDGLRRAAAEIDATTERPASQSPALRNRLTAASLGVRTALLREETRGVHRRDDFPQADPNWLKHIVLQKGRPPLLVPV